VDGTDGNVWALTIASPNQMLRGGLTKTTFKLGDEVIVEGYLAKGTGDNCPTALPNACETLAFPALSAAAQQAGRLAQHASATSITTTDGRNLFDRPAFEKVAQSVQGDIILHQREEEARKLEEARRQLHEQRVQ
jgi:hypothetical protein